MVIKSHKRPMAPKTLLRSINADTSTSGEINTRINHRKVFNPFPIGGLGNCSLWFVTKETISLPAVRKNGRHLAGRRPSRIESKSKIFDFGVDYFLGFA